MLQVVKKWGSYISTGDTPAALVDAYRLWLNSTMGEDELVRIRTQVTQEKVLGQPRFQAMLDKTLNRPVTAQPRGRPTLKKGDGGN